MAEISAFLVRDLRERTGSGMMECKRALVASGGNIEKAIEDMRKSGQAKADKKASRVAAEGLVMAALSFDRTAGVLLEVNCETDFVARDASFITFVHEVTKKALESGKKTVTELSDMPYNDVDTIDVARKNLIAKIGENVSLRRMVRIETTGHLASYIHGGHIGVLVELEGGDEMLGKDIAMHIAASNPLVVRASDLPAELLAKEREIFVAQTANTGKPAEMVEKMIEGRMRKYLEEVSLENQLFVKDPNLAVAALLAQHKARMIRFERFVVGEGIQKQETDFLAEVRAVQAAAK